MEDYIKNTNRIPGILIRSGFTSEAALDYYKRLKELAVDLAAYTKFSGDPLIILNDIMLGQYSMGESSLSAVWDTPEEDDAWAHL